jgi:hypothetical protein
MSDEAPRRLEDLILYTAQKMERDHHAGIGLIKLAKLLWRIDFTAYWRLERPITEATYKADKFGPAPVQELLAIRDLEAAGRSSGCSIGTVDGCRASATNPTCRSSIQLSAN